MMGGCYIFLLYTSPSVRWSIAPYSGEADKECRRELPMRATSDGLSVCPQSAEFVATPFECQLTYIGIEVLLDEITGFIVHLLQNHFTAVNDVKTL